MKEWKATIEQPTYLNLKRIGSNNWEEFVAQGERISKSIYEEMATFYPDGMKAKRILDFGCGVGRVILPLHFNYDLDIHGCDIDRTAIEYLSKVVPGSDIYVNNFEPPLKYADGYFDVVYSVSIWTHLNPRLQAIWLNEIQRVTKPGGLVLISTAGFNSLRIRHEKKWELWQGLSKNELKSKGIVYYEYPWLHSRSNDFPGVTESYGGSMHTPQYIRKEWSKYFNVVATKEACISNSQDLTIMTNMRKTPDAANSQKNVSPAAANRNVDIGYVKRRIKELAPWYHKIDLGNGIVTPGRSYDRLWQNISSVMDKLDYKGKNVLDIASWDGKWAFDAERRGARQVVSTDIRMDGFNNLLFAREILQSNVVPLCNVPVQELQKRLEVVRLDANFDIVHHLGLFYHLRDPLLSLSQARSVMKVGGLLVLETAFIDDDENSYMAFAGVEGNYHFYGVSDTWAPTKLCLKEVLIRSLFEPILEKSWKSMPQPQLVHKGTNLKLGRITMIAKAVAENSLKEVELRKITGKQ
ncbi:MAG: class I SAM-dependent methyltransferase [Chromatiaceae bacterium]|nr:class I SAM-dependent methyltransferase [Chromatiaceae bacterium]